LDFWLLLHSPVPLPLNLAYLLFFLIWNSVFLSQIPTEFLRTIQITPVLQTAKGENESE